MTEQIANLTRTSNFLNFEKTNTLHHTYTFLFTQKIILPMLDYIEATTNTEEGQKNTKNRIKLNNQLPYFQMHFNCWRTERNLTDQFVCMLWKRSSLKTDEESLIIKTLVYTAATGESCINEWNQVIIQDSINQTWKFSWTFFKISFLLYTNMARAYPIPLLSSLKQPY